MELTLVAALAAHQFGADVGGWPIIADYSAPTLLGVAVLMVLLGWLVPKASTKPLREENEHLRASVANLEQALKETVRQNSELMEMNHLVRSVFTALEEASK